MVIWQFLVATLAMAPLDRHSARAWSIDDGLPQSSVTAIAQDHNGWLHLGTFGGRARFDGQRFDVAVPTEGVGWSSVRITALAIGDDDTRWLGLQSGHVVRIDADGHDLQLPTEPTLIGTPIWSLLTDGDGVWVGGSGGLARWDDDRCGRSDPRAALGAMEAGVACNLLLTDVLMPGLTGSELAALVLAMRPGLPILFVSGFLRDVDAAALPGVLLPKPFGTDDVIAAIEAAMQRAARDSAAAL